MKLNRFILLCLCFLFGCSSGISTAKEYKITKSVDAMELCSALDKVYASNAFIKLQVNKDEYQYLRVNKKGEAYNQSGLIELPDNIVVSLNTEDNKVYRTNEGLNLTEIKCMLKLADDGKADIRKSEEDNVATYTMRLSGKDNILSYYALLTNGDTDFSNIAYNVILENAKDEASVFIELKVAVNTEEGDNNGLSAISTFGDKDSLFTAWIIDGYIPTCDWELDDEWYSKNLTPERYKELYDALDKQCNIDLVLSNNDIFKSGVTWEDYKKSKEKNTLLSQIYKDLEKTGIKSTIDLVTLKRELEKFYADEAYTDVPIIKAVAYISALSSQAAEVEPEAETGVEIPQEVMDQIVGDVNE